MYFYTSYCNYEAINHQLLKKIIEQNHQIKKHLKLETEEVEDDPPKASWFSPVKGMDIVTLVVMLGYIVSIYSFNGLY